MKRFRFVLLALVLALNSMSLSAQEDYTEIVYIVDRSGSMQDIEDGVILGLNSMFKEQKCGSGKAIVSTVLFSDGCTMLHDRVDVNEIGVITKRDYDSGGMTALYDAVGMAITKTADVQMGFRKKHRAKSVLFVITTDGYDNVSREYSASSVKKLIEKYKAENGWGFVFMGANIDVDNFANNIGISKDMAVEYIADSQGIKVLNEGVSSLVSSLRENGEIDAEWRESISADKSARADGLTDELDLELSFEISETPEIPIGDDEPVENPCVSPSFKGSGVGAFKNWVRRQIKYPLEAANKGIQGVVNATFVVERDGTIGRIRILYAPSEALANEVIRVLRLSPKWKPGVSKEKYVPVIVAVPIVFKLA